MSSKKRKIVFSIPSAVVGGIENHLARQLRLFDREQYEVSVILLFSKSKILLRDILPEHVNVYEFSFKNIYDFSNLQKLGKLLKKLDPEIVVTSAFDANAIFRILKPRFRYIVIPRLHNLYPDQPLHLRIFDKILSTFTPTIVAVSEDVADYAARRTWIPRKKFTVIPNGIDLVETNSFRKTYKEKEELLEELGLSKENKIILNVGRLRAQKNLKLAIDAFAHFKKEAKDNKTQFIIVGDGGEKEALQKRVKEMGVEDSVMFLGLHKNTFKFYMIADMFLLTSIREGFPNVLLESMAFGVPFISTRVPGATEAIIDGWNGFLAESTAEDLAGKIEALVDVSQEEAEQYRKKCLETAEKYSMENNVRRYKDLFSKLAR